MRTSGLRSKYAASARYHTAFPKPRAQVRFLPGASPNAGSDEASQATPTHPSPLKCNPAVGLPLPGAHLVEVADAHGLGEHLFELRGVAGVGSPGEIVVVILTGVPASIADDVR